MRLVHREQGLIVAPGNPLGLAGRRGSGRPGLRYVNRQRGAGTRVLLDHELGARAASTPDAIDGIRARGAHPPGRRGRGGGRPRRRRPRRHGRGARVRSRLRARRATSRTTSSSSPTGSSTRSWTLLDPRASAAPSRTWAATTQRRWAARSATRAPARQLGIGACAVGGGRPVADARALAARSSAARARSNTRPQPRLISTRLNAADAAASASTTPEGHRRARADAAGSDLHPELRDLGGHLGDLSRRLARRRQVPASVRARRRASKTGA